MKHWSCSIIKGLDVLLILEEGITKSGSKSLRFIIKIDAK